MFRFCDVFSPSSGFRNHWNAVHSQQSSTDNIVVTMEPSDSWFSWVSCLDRLQNVLFASALTGEAWVVALVVLWLHIGIHLYLLLTEKITNYGRGAALYKTWQSEVYRVDLFDASAFGDFRRAGDKRTPSLILSKNKVQITENGNKRLNIPHSLDPGEIPNQSCIFSHQIESFQQPQMNIS